MDQEILDIIIGADTRDWKKIPVEFGDEPLNIQVPAHCDVLSMPTASCLSNVRQAVLQALNQPIGSQEYKTLLHLFKILGPDGYNHVLQHPDWVFTKDQWEPQMWGKPYRKVGMDGLIYCSPQIPKEHYDIIPGLSGYDVIQDDTEFDSHRARATAMVQNAIIYAVHHPRFAGHQPTIAYIEEGPYAVPMARE